MNILITGNMGYIGSELVKDIRQKYTLSKIIGYDIGYFKDSLTNTITFPEKYVDVQYSGDIRKFDKNILSDIDSIVHLAAISNDPIGNSYGSVTTDVNYLSTIDLAKKASQMGVKNFVFASSCSIYGNGTTESRNEKCETNPLTAYSKSKINAEEELKKLADKNFCVSSLRFATACGMSDRLRFDLVLNDFVASAHTKRKIEILSDGTPWRPLINVSDMCRAIDWALNRKKELDEPYIMANVGKNENNIQIKDLAFLVKDIFREIEVEINHEAQPDKRSYKVNFDFFSSFAGKYLPIKSLSETVDELKKNLIQMSFKDKNFRKSNLIRLNNLSNLRNQNKLNSNLEWIN
ncbi:MAG: SDR family oxidoreductase [Ignavibacteriales bacterium]|nr:SDR family oxidoreductase [Ignavibacteriales bacterium]